MRRWDVWSAWAMVLWLGTLIVVGIWALLSMIP